MSKTEEYYTLIFMAGMIEDQLERLLELERLADGDERKMYGYSNLVHRTEELISRLKSFANYTPEGMQLTLERSIRQVREAREVARLLDRNGGLGAVEQ